MADLKEHGLTVSVSTIATLVPVLAAVWFVMQPLMVSQISSAMASDLEDMIEDETKPIEGAFKVLLQSDINRLKRNIARLEYREEHEPDEWTEADSQRLADYKIELDAFEEAIDDLE